MNLPNITHGFIEAAGVRVFYRETGPDTGIPVLLLHGFPSGSHQFRRLMDALGTEHRLIAPDYPGFGHTEAPENFEYTFERLTDVIEAFVAAKRLEKFVLYLFDFGGPVGLRLALRHPDRIAGLIIQNANAYHEGLSPLVTEATPESLAGLLAPAVTRSQYETGASRPEWIAPDGWILDQHFLESPERQRAQLALLHDYPSNVAQYPEWQRWLRDHHPPTLIVWGRGDPFFTEAGAEAYLLDLPEAELHLFETGHFALEECLPEIAPLIARFLEQRGG